MRDGAAWLYGAGEPGGPDRAQIDAVKRVLAGAPPCSRGAWDTLVADDDLRTRATRHRSGATALRAPHPARRVRPGRGISTTKLDEFVAATACRPARRSRTRRAEPSLERRWTASAGRRSPALLAALADWRGGRRAALRLDLLRRYIGFPIWDAITYPIAVEHEVGERDGEIELYRVSPRETRSSRLPTARSPSSREWASHHFGAFFARPEPRAGLPVGPDRRLLPARSRS